MNEKPSVRVKFQSLSGQDAYTASMTLIRSRLLVTKKLLQGPGAGLLVAEELALQVRKIIEGVAYAMLGAAEFRNNTSLTPQRSKDADKLLCWLSAKGMLQLPQAQRIEKSPSSEYKAVFCGAQQFNLDVHFLKNAYGRASQMIHERHPEGMSDKVIANEFVAIKSDAERLYEWLWLHMMFFSSEAIIVQMGQYGTPSYIIPITKIGDLPEYLA